MIAFSFTVALLVAQDEVPAAPTPESRIVRAQDLLADGKVAAARKLLETLASTGCEDPRVLHGLGRVCLKSGDYDDAVAHLVAASKAKKDDYAILVDLGDALFFQGQQAAWSEDYETAGYALMDARRMYERAAELDTSKAAPWLGAARAERQRGDLGEAENLLDKALAIDPDDVGALVELASILFPKIFAAKNAGNQPAADDERSTVATLYHRALEEQPDNAFALNGLAWVALTADRNDEAVGWFHRSLVADPTMTDSYDNLEALLTKNRDDRKKLVGMLDDVVAAASRHAEGDARMYARAVAHYRRGIAHALQRDANGLDVDLKRAAELWPEFKNACEFERVRGLYRDNAYPKATRILLKLSRHDFDGLLSTIGEQKNPNDAVLMIRGLADKAYKDIDLEGARELFKITAIATIDSADDWNNYAFFARESGAFEESYDAYERALELDPGNPRLLNDTALILHYHLQRDLDHAEELYAAAIDHGQRLLDDGGLDANASEATKVAVFDATNNLTRLKRQRDPTKKKAGKKARRIEVERDE